MSEPNEVDTNEVSPERVDFLEMLLTEGALLAAEVGPPPDAAKLVRYLSCALSEEAAEQIENSLIASAAACGLLRDVQRSLDVVQAVSLHEVARLARNEDLTGQVAQAWLSLMAERQGRMAQALRLLASHGWEGLRRLIAEGDAAALAAWTLLRAFGAQMRIAARMPRLATAKSGEAGQVAVAGAPEGVSLEISEAEAATNGALNVSFDVRDAQGRPTDALSGMTAHLALRVAGAVCPIESGVIEGSRIAWSLAGLGSELGLPEGSVAPDTLLVTLGEAAAPASEKPALFVEVVDAEGEPVRRPVMLELRSEPRWEGGQLRVEVALSPEVRIAYESHRLLLSLAMTPQGEQQIGAWPLSEWKEEVRTLTASCPEIPDTVLPAVALRARLAPAEA